MLFDHYRIDAFRVTKGEEAESPRATCGTITHDSAFADLAKLCEVALEGIFERLVSIGLLKGEGKSVGNSTKMKPWPQRNLPSVVSQFKPPINIFLPGSQQMVVHREQRLVNLYCGWKRIIDCIDGEGAFR